MKKNAQKRIARTPKLPEGVSWEIDRAGFVDGARQGNSGMLEMGLHWHNLTRYKLWVGHYKSANAMLKGELEERGITPPPRVTLEQAGRVAAKFGVNAKLGWSLLFRALVYWSVIGKTDFNVDDPGSELINVPVLGSILTKPLIQCTEKDVIEATAAARVASPKPNALTIEEVALQKMLQAGLTKLVGDDGRGTLKLSRPKGKLRVSLSLQMDVDRVDGLSALLKHLG